MHLKTFISCCFLSFGCCNLFSEITKEEFLFGKLISWEVDSKIYDQLSEKNPQVKRSTLAFEYNQSIVGTIIERLLK